MLTQIIIVIGACLIVGGIDYLIRDSIRKDASTRMCGQFIDIHRDFHRYGIVKYINPITGEEIPFDYFYKNIKELYNLYVEPVKKEE